MINKNKKTKQGFTIVEIMVVIVVIVSVFGAILSFFSLDIKNNERNRSKLKAVLLAQEAMEAVRDFRDNNNWSENGLGALSVGAGYHPVISSSGWNIILGAETLENFTRTVFFYNVSREADGDIENTYNPVNNDPDTRRVTVTMNWNDRYGPVSESLTTYLTNWRD